MNEVIAVSIAVKIIMAVIGILALFITLRVFDKVADIKFKEVFDGIESDPRAAALYLGLRFLGVCIVLAATFL
jgi:uncharacterized membrane protein YjfL (UPF0719 family)